MNKERQSESIAEEGLNFPHFSRARERDGYYMNEKIAAIDGPGAAI
jgi:hypothetical protein